jgi:hypothetical protein
MQPLTPAPLTDLLKLSTTVGGAFANPLGTGIRWFRSLSKDQQAALIGLASLLGLAYALHHFSTRR